MGDLFKFLNERFNALIQALKSTQQGYDENTHEYGGGGIDNISDKTDAIKTTTDTIKTNTDNIKSSLANIYNLLDIRMLKRVVISRADYDALVTKDPDTLYYVIESQSNPSNP